MYKVFITVFLCIGTLLPLSSTAQNFEFRFVNKQALVNGLALANMGDLQSQIRQYEMKVRDDIDATRKKISELQYDAQFMTGQERENTQKEIERLRKEFESQLATVEQKKNDLTESFFKEQRNRVERAIENISDQQNIDYVLETHNENGEPILLYFTPDKVAEYDITSKVAELLRLR